ncbi:hypothetical protein ATSB10_06450 [Dyella thiooxydans]|uniref:Uncharacterized protein n=1 Tax=Dyella thiooxydans TaxID=445710 RepID=A0A169GPM9_9GAMM|nr:hypothetical protein ATSB10_06450 [Dyella thiooxydans]
MSLGHRPEGRGLHTIGTGPVHPARAEGYGACTRRRSRAVWKRSLLQMPGLAGALVAIARRYPWGIIGRVATNRWASGPGYEPRSRRACRWASKTLRAYQSVGGEHRTWLSGRSPLPRRQDGALY